MLLDILAVTFGLVGLFLGGDWLVLGAARLAQALKVPPLIIGLTVVSLGTSSPELVVNVSAALRGSTEIALGNIVGSNIANVGLILALAGIITPVAIGSTIVRREVPITIVCSVILFGLALDGQVGFWDGLILFSGFFAVSGMFYWAAGHDEEVEPPLDDAATRIHPMRELGRVALGIIVLIIAAQFTVEGATNLAEAAGISKLAIGLTLVAFGTSLPELAATLAAAYRKETDILMGNILGSNIYNIVLILGLTAIIQPVPVATTALQIQFPIMIAHAIFLLPVARDRAFGRREGLLYIASYAIFLALTFGRS